MNNSKPSSSSMEGQKLRSGEWTMHEEKYCTLLISEFRAGFLSLEDGCSLRQFLARMLHCQPTRISKRFEGSNYNKGKKYYAKSLEKLAPQEAMTRRARLMEHEQRFWVSVKRTGLVVTGGENEGRDGLLSSSMLDTHIPAGTPLVGLDCSSKSSSSPLLVPSSALAPLPAQFQKPSLDHLQDLVRVQVAARSSLGSLQARRDKSLLLRQHKEQVAAAAVVDAARVRKEVQLKCDAAQKLLIGSATAQAPISLKPPSSQLLSSPTGKRSSSSLDPLLYGPFLRKKLSRAEQQLPWREADSTTQRLTPLLAGLCNTANSRKEQRRRDQDEAELKRMLPWVAAQLEESCPAATPGHHPGLPSGALSTVALRNTTLHRQLPRPFDNALYAFLAAPPASSSSKPDYQSHPLMPPPPAAAPASPTRLLLQSTDPTTALFLLYRYREWHPDNSSDPSLPPNKKTRFMK